MSLQNLVRRIRHPSPHLAPSLPAAGTAPGLRPPSRPLQGLSAVRAHQGGPYHNPSKTTTHLSHCYPAARGLAVIKQKLSRMCQGGSPPWHPPGPARPSPCHPLPRVYDLLIPASSPRPPSGSSVNWKGLWWRIVISKPTPFDGIQIVRGRWAYLWTERAHGKRGPTPLANRLTNTGITYRVLTDFIWRWKLCSTRDDQARNSSCDPGS